MALPDFRNPGVLLRAVLLAELAALLWAWLRGLSPAAYFSADTRALLLEPVLLSVLFLLFAASPWLARLPYRLGLASVIACALLCALLWHWLFTALLALPIGHGYARSAAGATLLAGALLFYFDWRQRALSPALSEARLAALQARIRPHFLFNSLNTVLGLIRADPRRAESVLENLADLFRALMADPRALVPLHRELELARAYVEIESLRLGNRLRVVWHDQDAPLTAQVPQLILQPLLENAVLHGIEPSAEGGEVHVNLFVKAHQLVIVIRNPLLADTPRRQGSHMALANIRERLDLHFDAEARMTHFTAGGEFVAQVEMPLR